VTNIEKESISDSYLDGYKIILEGEAKSNGQRFGVSPDTINYTKLPSPEWVSNPGDFFISRLNKETSDDNKAAGELIYDALDDIYDVLKCLVTNTGNAAPILDYLGDTIYTMKTKDYKIVCHNS
jgi:hypothetical protein